MGKSLTGRAKCAFHSGGDPAEALSHLQARFEQGLELPTLSKGRTTDRPAGVGAFYTALIGALYDKQYGWPELARALRNATKGDGTPMLAIADGYNGRAPDGTYDNETDVYAAVTCAESDIGTDGVSTLEGLAKIDAAAPILGKYFAEDDYAVLDTACSNWPEPVAKLPTKFDAPGAPPIMVVATTNDPATPYAGGVSLSKQLSSGVLVTHKGEGHTAYNKSNSCVNDTVDDFLVSGTVPKKDPMC